MTVFSAGDTSTMDRRAPRGLNHVDQIIPINRQVRELRLSHSCSLNSSLRRTLKMKEIKLHHFGTHIKLTLEYSSILILRIRQATQWQ